MVGMNILDFPDGILMKIFLLLETTDVLNCMQTCRGFLSIVQDTHFLNKYSRYWLGVKFNEIPTMDMIHLNYFLTISSWHANFKIPTWGFLVLAKEFLQIVVCEYSLQTFSEKNILLCHVEGLSGAVQGNARKSLNVWVKGCLCKVFSAFPLIRLMELKHCSSSDKVLCDGGRCIAHIMPPEVKLLEEEHGPHRLFIETVYHDLSAFQFTQMSHSIWTITMSSYQDNIFIVWIGAVDYSSYNYTKTGETVQFKMDCSIEEIRQKGASLVDFVIRFFTTNYHDLETLAFSPICKGARMCNIVYTFSDRQKDMIMQLDSDISKSAKKVCRKVKKCIHVPDLKVERDLKDYLDGLGFDNCYEMSPCKSKVQDNQPGHSTSVAHGRKARKDSKTLEVALHRCIRRAVNKLVIQYTLVHSNDFYPSPKSQVSQCSLPAKYFSRSCTEILLMDVHSAEPSCWPIHYILLASHIEKAVTTLISLECTRFLCHKAFSSHMKKELDHAKNIVSRYDLSLCSCDDTCSEPLVGHLEVKQHLDFFALGSFNYCDQDKGPL